MTQLLKEKKIHLKEEIKDRSDDQIGDFNWENSQQGVFQIGTSNKLLNIEKIELFKWKISHLDVSFVNSRALSTIISQNLSATAQLRILSSSWKAIKFGVTKQVCLLKGDIGSKELEWAYDFEQRVILHEQDYMTPTLEAYDDEIVIITINREKGTLRFKIGAYEKEFEDRELMFDDVVFCLGLNFKET